MTSFGLAGWLVVTRVAAGALAVVFRAGAFAMDSFLAALVWGTIGVEGPEKEIVFFSGTGSDTEATGSGCAMVSGVECEGGRVSFCATLAAGFVEAGCGLAAGGFSLAGGSDFVPL